MMDMLITIFVGCILSLVIVTVLAFIHMQDRSSPDRHWDALGGIVAILVAAYLIYCLGVVSRPIIVSILSSGQA